MRFNNPQDRQRLAKETGCVLSQQCMVMSDGSRVVGYQNYNGNGVELLLSMSKPFTRSFLATIFTYPFAQLGVKRLWAQVAVSNERCWSLCERLGFVREGILRLAANDGDAYLYSMTAPEYGAVMCWLLKGKLGDSGSPDPNSP